MRIISAMDLRRRLGEMLDQAAAGERIVIERDRRPLAVLVPYGDALVSEETEAQRRLRTDAAFESLRRHGLPADVILGAVAELDGVGLDTVQVGRPGLLA